MAESTTLHATCVAVGGMGVLLLGSPGSGKSSLALCLIDEAGRGISGEVKPGQLVADDQVTLRREGAALVASAPAALSGKLEIRGLGIVEVTTRQAARVHLVARLVPVTEIERLPEPQSMREILLGVELPAVRIDATQAVAPARIRAALDLLVKV